MSIGKQRNLRNIAIIAHVDHGKTTLIDELLKQSGLFRENESVNERMMDSDAQEKERGITILAKTTAIRYKENHINIVDTPGHADFSGEVERTLAMVDGVCLLVDAFEGPMPQTKFVIQKVLKDRLKTIVVINKIDREGGNPQKTLEKVYDLFIELGANDEQLDFPVIYTSAKEGRASKTLENVSENMEELYEMILEEIPPPISYIDKNLQVLVTNLDYSDYVGKLGMGRILSGVMNKGQEVFCLGEDKKIRGKITKIYTHIGLKRIEVDSAQAGDIIVWAGVPDMTIGDTIVEKETTKALKRIYVDEPTLVMFFTVNDSPFSGQDGKFITSHNLRERLYKEALRNVSLRVEDTDSFDTLKVTGRGELHLSVLIENMRREGYEFQVSKPTVRIKEKNGRKLEPFEELLIDVEDKYSGSVIEFVGRCKGDMIDMYSENNNTRLSFLIPARALIGFRSQFMTLTRGYGTMCSTFAKFDEVKCVISERQNGVLISKENAESSAYAIYNLQERGTFFLSPGTKVYKGQIVGEHNRNNDLTVSIGKSKKVTNIRAAGADENIVLKTPRTMSLEEAIEYINNDELVEITPNEIRLRKRYLDENKRKKTQIPKNV